MLQRQKGNDFRDLNLSVWHQASTLPQVKYDMCVKYPTEAGKLGQTLQQQNQRTTSIAVTPTGSYEYSSSECNEVLDALLTPRKTAGIVCAFPPLGQKLTSRAVHMRNIFSSVGRKKSGWGLQNNSASHYCQSHHSQNVRASQANSPTHISLSLPLSSKFLAARKCFIPIRFQSLQFSGSSSPL